MLRFILKSVLIFMTKKELSNAASVLKVNWLPAFINVFIWKVLSTD